MNALDLKSLINDTNNLIYKLEFNCSFIINTKKRRPT